MSLITSTAQRTLWLSGQGGGKTFTEGVLAYCFAVYFPQMKGLIAANTYLQLSDSTLAEIFKVWAQVFGIKEFNDSNKGGFFVVNKYPPDDWKVFEKYHQRPTSPHNKIFFKNGAMIYTASLDNYKALDGRTIGWALLDETKDTKEDAVKMVILGRLRQKGLFLRDEYKKHLQDIFSGKSKMKSIVDLLPFTSEDTGHPINPLYMFTTPYKELWLLSFFGLDKMQKRVEEVIFSKDDYFSNTQGNKKVIIASNYHNEKNLPANYIKNLIDDLPSELIDLKIYASPYAKGGKEYARGFDKKIHVSSIQVQERAQIHFTVDFNINPYMSGLVIQIVPQKGNWGKFENWIEIRVIKEYALAYPNNEARQLGRKLIEDFPQLCKAGFFLYGDASGNAKLGIGNKTMFTEVLQSIGAYSSLVTKRVPASNPKYSHISKGALGRKSFLNVILEGKKPVKVVVDENCKEFINDLQFCEEDADGKLAKPKTNGVELRGHHLQAFEYFLCHPETFGKLAIL